MALCECGCGGTTAPSKQTTARTGYAKGQPQRFILGHQARTRVPQVDLGRTGLCECGCGERTKIATKTKPGRQIKGQPLRFIVGHAKRPVGKRRSEITAADYAIEDRGYLTPCWVSRVGLRPDGYARLPINGRHQYMHRAMYEAEVGSIPEGMELDHLCSVRHCINPEHLEPVTPAENVRRSSRWSQIP